MMESLGTPGHPSALPTRQRVSVRALERLIASLRTTQDDRERLAQEALTRLEEPVGDHASRLLQLERFRETAARARRQTPYYHARSTRLGLDPAHVDSDTSLPILG